MDHRYELIDVRLVPPQHRHPLIFATFDSLPVGGAFEIVNDHDPRPLFHQFAAIRDGQFDWSYLEAGPEQWHVRIGKRSQGDIAGVPGGCGSGTVGCGCGGGG